MKWGLFTCPYQRLALEQAFADAAAFGYDYIELWGGRPHAYAPDLLRGGLGGVLRLIDRYALPVEVYTPEHNAYPFNYMTGSQSQWEDCMDYLSAALSCGKALGARHTLISIGHSGFQPRGRQWERLLRSMRRLADRAEQLEHTIVVETLTPFESDTCTRLRDLERLLDAVGSPMLLAVCDVVVPFVQGEDPADYPRRLGGRMAHLHLTDSDGVSETHLLPGDGCMDLKTVLGDIRAAGYDGTATLELVTHYMNDPSGSARAALSRVKELL